MAGILLVSVNFGWQVIQNNVKSQAIREVQQNVRFCMEKITESILDASLVNSPAAGSSGSSLFLAMQSTSSDPTIIELANEKLQITQAGAGPYELTNNRVRVISCQFVNLSYEGTPGTIRVRLTIEHINPNNLTLYDVSLDTEETITLRK